MDHWTVFFSHKVRNQKSTWQTLAIVLPPPALSLDQLVIPLMLFTMVSILLFFCFMWWQGRYSTSRIKCWWVGLFSKLWSLHSRYALYQFGVAIYLLSACGGTFNGIAPPQVYYVFWKFNECVRFLNYSVVKFKSTKIAVGHLILSDGEMLYEIMEGIFNFSACTHA